MEFNCPVVGIDVAKEKSCYCLLSPSGSVYRKPFEASNDGKGLSHVLAIIKKMEETFGSWPTLVIESTGHYSARLVHFFTRNALQVILINPIQSHSIKNSGIRKTKTDKLDAEELARLPFILNLRPYEPKTPEMANLQTLCRTLHHLSEQKVATLNQLVSLLDQVWVGFTEIFPNVSSKTSVEFLTNYPSPAALLAAGQDDVIRLIMTNSRRGPAYAENKYALIRQKAQESQVFGIQSAALFICITVYVSNLKHMTEQMERLQNEIEALSVQIPDVDLLKSIPGLGANLAPVIAAEIGGINRFNKAKQLVAYCGVDPCVRQSGKFTGSHNKVTKRGSPYLRRALYIAATVAIRKSANGTPVNSVLHDYYQEKIKNKAKKQALGAVMNKLLHIIFSVLRNKKPFVLITAEEQRARFKQKLSLAA